MITLEDYISASGKYPERLTHPELTQDVKDNATKLLDLVNSFLSELNISKITVTSGWRPSSVNASIKNAAKKSSHMVGFAVDLADSDGELDELVGKNDDLLKKYGLWQESPGATPGWCHLDCKDRGKRKKNQFIP
jgi:hypothetical protein